MDNLLENTLPKLMGDKTDNLNSPLLNKVKLLTKNLPQRKIQTVGFIGKIYQTFKEEIPFGSVQFSSVQSLSCVRLFATPWIAARQASLSVTNSQSSPKLINLVQAPS